MWLNLRGPSVLPRLGVTPSPAGPHCRSNAQKIRPGLLRARSLHGARGTSARAAIHSSHFLEGWLNMRDLGAVPDHEEPLPHLSGIKHIPSPDHQRSVIRRRRNETRTLRLRSSRATTRAGLGLTHALCLNVAILQSCCQSSTSCPSTNCLAYSIAVSSSGHTSPIARLIRPSLSMM